MRGKKKKRKKKITAIEDYPVFYYELQVAFDKIGPMTTNAITKERKRQKSAVMAELDQRLRLLNSAKSDDKWSDIKSVFISFCVIIWNVKSRWSIQLFLYISTCIMMSEYLAL